MKAIASSSSNTWGLFLLVLLLGHALVEIPRNLWNNSKPGYALQYSYFKVTKVWGEKSDAEEQVDRYLESLQVGLKNTLINFNYIFLSFRMSSMW